MFGRQQEQLLRARAISTGQCAQLALRGLRGGRFYIQTQPHIRQDVDRHDREITAAFDRMGLSG